MTQHSHGNIYLPADAASATPTPNTIPIADANGKLDDWITPGGGITDHGALTGLADNDHPQYRLAATAIDHGALTGLADDDHPQYVKHSLATAVSDFLVASGAGAFVKKTLAEVKTILGLGSAAYTASTAYLAAGGKAADSEKLDNYDSSAFWRKAEAVAADTVDGYHAASIYRTDYPAFVFSYSVAVAQAARNIGNYTFSPPAEATIVLVRIAAKWTTASDGYLMKGCDSAGGNATAVARAFVANQFVDGMGIIPVVGGVCHYSIVGANALSATISILGYWR